MRKMLMIGAFLALAGCPKPALMEPAFVQNAPGIWTAWPPPFEYTDMGEIAVQDWTRLGAQAAAVAQVQAAGGVGVAGAHWEARVVTLPASQCATTPGCMGGGVPLTDDETGDTLLSNGQARIWTLVGRAVGVWHAPEHHEPSPAAAPSSIPAISP